MVDNEREIAFFLASSIEDVEYDRLAVGDYIRQLNDLYHSSGIYIKLYKCESENLDHAVNLNGSQENLDDIIRRSDLCFVIFFEKVGEYTRHEFEVAIEEFRKKKSPKVIVYFKTITDDKDIPNEVREIMSFVDDELKHYHLEYKSIDTLKLGIIMQLQVNGFVGLDLKVDGESIKVNNEKIVSISGVPIFAKNEEYAYYLQERARIFEEYSILLEEYNAGKEALTGMEQKKLDGKKKELDRINEDIDEMTEEIMNAGRAVARMSFLEEVNDRIRQAIQCYDKGDFDGVLNILSVDELRKGDALIKENYNQADNKALAHIEEYRLVVRALVVKKEWEMVKARYEDCIDLIEGHAELPKDMMFEYAKHLYGRKQYKESLGICRRLENCYGNAKSCHSPDDKSQLLELIGDIYYCLSDFAASKEPLKEAIAIREELARNDRNEKVKVADLKVKLAKNHFKVNEHDDAERLYNEALAIYNEFDVEGIQFVDVKIAEAYVELGNLYYMVNKHEKSEELKGKAYLKFKELYDNNKDEYGGKCAEAAKEYAVSMISEISHRESDPMHLEAFAAKRILSKEGLSGYDRFLTDICNKLEALFSELHKDDCEGFVRKLNDLITAETGEEREVVSEANDSDDVDLDYYSAKVFDMNLIRTLCDTSVQIYEKLAKEDPIVYEDNLAMAYDTFANYFVQAGEFDKAKEYYLKSINTLERLRVLNEETISKLLALVYSHYAYGCYLVGTPEACDDSEQFRKNAISVYETIADKKGGAYDTDLARNYNDLAKLYKKTGKTGEAEKLFLNAIELYVKLYLESPRAYIDRIINTVYNTVDMLIPGKADAWMASVLPKE